MFKTKTKTNPTVARLKTDFEAACNNYLRAFCEKHGYDYEDARWIGDDVGGVAEVCDYCISIDTIRTDIDQNASENEFIEWHDYCLRLGMLSTETINIPTPNFRSWLMGCPRKSEEWFGRAEACQRGVKRARAELEKILEETKDEQGF